MLLLHYTGMPDGSEALRKLCDPGREVSAHYFVGVDGRVLQLVPEARRAWHAGVASWRGEDDVNSLSIGVEIDNPGHDGGMPPFAEPQIAAVIALCRDIVARWAIPAERVLGHSDVAPLRKLDPGEAFPWARLAAAGVGHYVSRLRSPLHGRSLAPGASGPPVAALQRDARELRLCLGGGRRLRRHHRGRGERLPAALPSRPCRRHRRCLDRDDAAHSPRRAARDASRQRQPYVNLIGPPSGHLL